MTGWTVGGPPGLRLARFGESRYWTRIPSSNMPAPCEPPLIPYCGDSLTQ